MIDVRNSHNKSMRLGSAKMGRIRTTPPRSAKYLTWHHWGWLHRTATDKHFERSFNNAFGNVHKYNIEKYGVDNAWHKVGSKYLNVDEINIPGKIGTRNGRPQYHACLYDEHKKFLAEGMSEMEWDSSGHRMYFPYRDIKSNRHYIPFSLRKNNKWAESHGFFDRGGWILLVGGESFD